MVVPESVHFNSLIGRLFAAATEATHPLLLPLLLYIDAVETMRLYNIALLAGIRELQKSSGTVDTKWLLTDPRVRSSTLSLLSMHKQVVTLHDQATSAQRDYLKAFGDALGESFTMIEHFFLGKDEEVHSSLLNKFLDVQVMASAEIRAESRYDAKLDAQHKVVRLTFSSYVC